MHKQIAMHKQSVGHDDWRQAERFDASVLMTIAIGILLATALVSLS